MNAQMKAMENARQATQLFNQRFEEKLKETQFPVEQLTPFWASHALKALTHASLLSLGINPEDWMKLLDAFDLESFKPKVKALNLHQFAILSNNLQARTPTELGKVRLEEYGDLMTEADSYVKTWQAISDKLREETEAEVSSELQMKEAAAGVGVGVGMKAVKE